MHAMLSDSPSPSSPPSPIPRGPLQLGVVQSSRTDPSRCRHRESNSPRSGAASPQPQLQYQSEHPSSSDPHFHDAVHVNDRAAVLCTTKTTQPSAQLQASSSLLRCTPNTATTRQLHDDDHNHQWLSTTTTQADIDPIDAIEDNALLQLQNLLIISSSSRSAATKNNNGGGCTTMTAAQQLRQATGQFHVTATIHELLVCRATATAASELGGNHHHTSTTTTTFTATQRDVFYRHEKFFSTQQQCNAAIARLSVDTGIPRSALGIVASGRGAVGGCLRVHGVDLRYIGPQGLAIDGSFAAVPILVNPSFPTGCSSSSSSAFSSESTTTTTNVSSSSSSAAAATSYPTVDVMEARMLLIVEKDAVFYRLMQDRIFDHVPVIVLSGFGFPSSAARCLAATICAAAEVRNHGAGPPLQVCAIVDYNPSGLQIMLRYMHATTTAVDADVRCEDSSVAYGRRINIKGGPDSNKRHRTHHPPDGKMIIKRTTTSSNTNGVASQAIALEVRRTVSKVEATGDLDGVVPVGYCSGLAHMRWFGLLASHHVRPTTADTTSSSSYVPSPLTTRDRHMLQRLIAQCGGDGGVPIRWKEELLHMQRTGLRYDIEGWDGYHTSKHAVADASHHHGNWNDNHKCRTGRTPAATGGGGGSLSSSWVMRVATGLLRGEGI